MIHPRSHVHVGRYAPGVNDDLPWYVGIHTQRDSGNGGFSPLSAHRSRAEALEAAVPLTGALLPDWQPFPAHVPAADTVRHPSPYDREQARALLAETPEPEGPDMKLRGRMCRCAGCGEVFGSPSAFDKHQHDDGRPNPCRPREWFTTPRGKAGRPPLVLHPQRGVWVLSLRDWNSDQGVAA